MFGAVFGAVFGADVKKGEADVASPFLLCVRAEDYLISKFLGGSALSSQRTK